MADENHEDNTSRHGLKKLQIIYHNNQIYWKKASSYNIVTALKIKITLQKLNDCIHDHS